MSHLTDDGLKQRAADIRFNVIARAPSDALAEAPRLQWDHLWRDVIDEAHRRFSSDSARDFLREIAASCERQYEARWRIPMHRAKELVRRASGYARPFLVRYSKRVRLADLVSKGRVRISPASSYSDPSLNPAIRDDELELTLQPNPGEFRVEFTDKATGLPKRIPLIGNLFTAHSPTNFYVYCVSELLSPALLTDFDADACVVITKPERFFDRLLDGVMPHLPGPGWTCGAARVQYVDPLNTRVSHVRVPLAKHFRYAYQREWRLLWYPPNDVQDLDALHVEVGSMEDCCELLCP